MFNISAYNTCIYLKQTLTFFHLTEITCPSPNVNLDLFGPLKVIVLGVVIGSSLQFSCQDGYRLSYADLDILDGLNVSAVQRMQLQLEVTCGLAGKWMVNSLSQVNTSSAKEWNGEMPSCQCKLKENNKTCFE